MRGLIRSLLDDSGFKLVEANNGEEAVAAFHIFHPSWIIMDIDMPVMDGLTATRTIQQIDDNARVIITQHDSPAIRTKTASLGAHAFLQKDYLSVLPTLLNLQPT
ncbi:UNVERIFIED_CONTAM: hypothetical protein GTU68_056738 [Idotea baltica]|nr:hypothetical protein [Idotea baltica]